MIRLYTTYYHEKNTNRRNEYLSCLRYNLDCEAIDRVVVVNENGDLPSLKTEKLTVIQTNDRPTYSDLFELINQNTIESDISIIANTDIYFGQSISVLNHLAFNDRCFALSRWDVGPKGKAVLFDRNDSQDVWIFKGRIKNINGDFHSGVPRCDNRIAYELEKAGYRVENPSFSIKSYHLHTGERGEYPGVNQSGYIEPPYKYIWPHNLFSLPGTLWHNLVHRDSRVSYRIDKRKINGWLAVRALRKIVTVFCGQNTHPKNSKNGRPI